MNNILGFLGQALQRFLVGTVRVDTEAERLYRRMAARLLTLVVIMLVAGLGFNIAGVRWLNVIAGLVLTVAILVQSFHPSGVLFIVLGGSAALKTGWDDATQKYVRIVMTIVWVGHLYFLYMATASFVENPGAFFGILLVVLIVLNGAFLRKLPPKKFWVDVFTMYYPITIGILLVVSLVPTHVWVNAGIPARFFADRSQDAKLAKLERRIEENANNQMADSVQSLYDRAKKGGIVTREELAVARDNRDSNSTSAKIAALLPHEVSVLVTIDSFRDREIEVPGLVEGISYKLKPVTASVNVEQNGIEATTSLSAIRANDTPKGKSFVYYGGPIKLAIEDLSEYDKRTISVTPKSVQFVFSRRY